ncbi:TPA: lipopolysaccharide biosynthesis protein [Stenotrophomonas maltophilia]|uniref:lipopolysaccharide biosynthesis protein n=1 Tax=Stenotrophomonas maltophilia TaxID=40324 RepID=UPI0021D8895B|nr:oligosaccharide flippase family protein [Stenotrophomonas maltophilia]UXY49857.1 oligosaccharide flippase family protein [Stenotrophomonas maltophilia]
MTAKGIYWGVASNLLGNALMLGATLWLTRLISPTEFGEFRVGANFSTLMIPFLALGGERLISRLIQKGDSAGVARTVRMVMTISLVGAAILLLAYPLLARYAFAGTVGFPVFALGVLLVPLTICYNLANTIWRHVGSPARAQIHLNFHQRLLRAPLLIVFAWLHPTAVSASAAMFVAQGTSLLQLWKHVRLALKGGSDPAKPRARSRSVIAEMLVIGLPVALLAAVDRVDVLIINAVMGVETAGEYDLVYMLALTAMFPAMAMSKTSEPLLLSLTADVGRQDRIRSLQNRTLLLSCAALIGIAVISPFIPMVLGVAGPDFPAAVLILSAGLALSSVCGPVLEYMQINGRARVALILAMSLMGLFVWMKWLAATADSLVMFAFLGGLFYFILRLSLAAYIFFNDRVLLTNPYLLAASIALYGVVGAWVIGGQG